MLDPAIKKSYPAVVLFGVEYQDSAGSFFLVTDLLLTCKKL
jgi:hypothetical protein